MIRTLKVIAVAIGIVSISACASLDSNQARVTPAAKLDNGLGQLPHYRDWVDPSGREPMAPMLTAEEQTRWP
jgi:hypothetical protein